MISNFAAIILALSLTGSTSDEQPPAGGGWRSFSYGGGGQLHYVPPPVTEADYPAASRDAGIEGTSMLRLLVTPSGQVRDCSTVRSAGTAELDAQACAIYRSRGRFRLRNISHDVVLHAPVVWKLVQEPRYSLVVARAMQQRDPQPAPCGRDGSCGDSMFLGRFDQARVVAGEAIPASFQARIRFHTPLISPTEMALIVEKRPDGSLIVRRRAGFNDRTNRACFREPDEEPVDWQPTGPGVTTDRGVICYRKSGARN